ncbi:MAG: transposase, partial [Prosthecobacter sp.]|uniref:transposase n=1 Tax=Prosthecobacter sp. TaxID=1965333 RepID=UPI0038FE073D
MRKVGMDEKSFGKGQDYISVMCDLDQARVLEVVPGRDTQSARELWQQLPEPVRGRVEAAAMDMSAGYQSATHIEAPQARIVFDKFHVAKHLGEAVDRTRRAEHKALTAQGGDTLKGTRYLFLYNPQNLSAEQSTSFEALLQINLKSGRAWAYKELFSEFWNQPGVEAARTFLKDWLGRREHKKSKALDHASGSWYKKAHLHACATSTPPIHSHKTASLTRLSLMAPHGGPRISRPMPCAICKKA